MFVTLSPLVFELGSDTRPQPRVQIQTKKKKKTLERSAAEGVCVYVCV